MLQSGQELSARFVLVRCLGSGGSGEVWLAQDRERARLVAVKILADELLQDAAAIAALQRECAQAARLDHPNILRVDDLYRSAHHAWIAMHYASGGDLSQLRGRGSSEILRAAAPIAAALAHAHRAGIVHRDVKPQNVLFASDGTPLLADFGMALAVATRPAPGAGRGSPCSMSPQQREGAPASVADDIYGFGAMLYELLSGYPPFYPDAAAAGSAKPAALPASVPPALVQLVDRLLARLPADRPADMQVVENELNAVLKALPAPTIIKTVNEPPAIRIEPPGSHAAPAHEPLRSQWRPSGAAGGDEGRPRGREGFRPGTGAAAIALGIGALALVFFALPQWVAEEEEPARLAPAASTTQPQSPAQGPAQAAARKKEELDFAALARAKQEAEEQRVAIAERLQKLTARAAERWGGEEFRRANEALAAGDKAFEAREYLLATRHFAEVEPLLVALEKRAGEVLAQQLKAGSEALQSGRSADAKAAFELAAKIEPENKSAARGLKRAATLDEVLALVARAEGMEREGNVTAAMGQFRKALALDAEAPRAAEGMTRIEARLAHDTFASAMARGFSALASADYGNAREAFEAARKIRPNAPEIAQALRQIEQEQRTGIISAKLEKAQALESAERWAEALREYRSVVELDSTVASAQQGVQRTTPRAALNEQLELYLTQPERLFSQPVRAAARETLARAASIAEPGPVLSRQMTTLEQWLARADVPVQVALQSDNVTQVTIYRIGTLGTFAQRSLELAPGKYTVVGTRPGYRDVRREISVTPGAALDPVVIRCEDRI